VNVPEDVKLQLVSQYHFSPEMVEIAWRARFKCEYCSADLLESVDDYEFNWEREHVVPTVAEGSDSFDNWALSCRRCNQFKGKWNPLTVAGDGASREELVEVARQYVQGMIAARQRRLAEVRTLVAAHLTL
jgi:5-methylcytosine-specific restriction endonuclease McrA